MNQSAISTNQTDTPMPSISPTKKLAGISWLHFLNDGSANFLPGILPAVLLALGEPVKMAGIIMSSLLIGQAFQPLMGLLADKLGGKKLLFIGLASSTIGGALLGVAHQLWVLIALLLLIGIGSAMFHPQALATARSLSRERQGLSVSIFMVGGELGRGIWPTLVSLLVVHFGLPSLWVLAIPALLTIPLVNRTVPSLPKRAKATAPLKVKDHLVPTITLVGFASTKALATVGIITFFPILWHLEGGSLVGGASILTTFLVVGVVGNLSGGHLADRVGRRIILVTAGIVSTLLIPLLTFSHGFILWTLAGIIGIAAYATSPVTILIGQDIFPENRSLGSGFAAGFSNGIAALLVFVISLYINENNITNVFWVLSAVALISTTLALIIPKQFMTHRSTES